MKKYTIGRGMDANIKIDYPKISEIHCSAQVVSEQYYIIEDLNSTNHTYINGRRIKSARYTSFDKLMLADKLIEYDWLDRQILHLDNNYKKEFNDLKKLYDDRQKKIKKIISKYDKRNIIFRIVLGMIPAIIGIGLLKSHSNIIILIRSALITSSVFSTVINSVIAKKSNPQIEKEIEAVKKDFYSKYKCPKCEFLFTETTSLILEAQGKCTRCGAKFI